MALTVKKDSADSVFSSDGLHRIPRPPVHRRSVIFPDFLDTMVLKESDDITFYITANRSSREGTTGEQDACISKDYLSRKLPRAA